MQFNFQPKWFYLKLMKLMKINENKMILFQINDYFKLMKIK